MQFMLNGCSNLEKINFGKINTSSLQNMRDFFQFCSKLTSIDLSMFDTSKVTDMGMMFNRCSNLKYLDLSNFDLSNLNKVDYMFQSCSSLIYLNMRSFKLNNAIDKKGMFNSVNSNVKFCTENEKLKNYASETRDIETDCNDICFTENAKIDIANKKCLKSCLDEGYLYECNNICYNECPNGSFPLAPLINESNNVIKCLDKAPEGYYLDKTDKKFKKCFENCKLCYGEGNETINNCEECKSNFIFYNESKYNTNCYEKCNLNYYFDESGQYHCEQSCPQQYNKLITDKNKCIDDCKKDDDYQYEYKNNCYKQCPNGTTHRENNYICFDENIKDERDIEIEIYKGTVSNFNVSENKEDIISKKDDVLFQITTSENQKNNTNKNISAINLGDCEDKLKEIYEVDSSLPLIIFKIDYFSPDSLIPIIGYEIYHPLNKSKLDLKYCEDILIKLNIPVSIDESKLFKYDPNSEFYNDNCFSYTTENGTDILLNDRKQEFTDNKLSLCENNCNYTGYNGDDKQSLCDCIVKNKMDTISEILSKPIELSNNFATESSSNSGTSNIITIKCTKALFSKEGLKNNISSYILIIFIGHFLLSIFLFVKCGYHILVNEINDIIREKEKIQSQISKNNTLTLGSNKTIKKKGKKKKRKTKIINFPPKKVSLNYININNKKESKNDNNKNNKQSLVPIILNNNSKIINKFKKENRKNKERSSIKNLSRNLTTKPILNKMPKIIYNDYELNSFDYKNALLYDERTCCQYYWSLIKIKNPIIFSFCPVKDYNSIIIKSCIFSLSFSIYYAINFFFFNDEIIHDIYEHGGKYDIIYFLPKIAISFAAAYYITTIIKLIFLSERNIIQVRKQTYLSAAHSISENVKRNLIIKYVIFFILGLIFLVFFWMLLSSFGAVYQNTQMFIFKNTLISFAMSLVYSCLNLSACIFRICSLKSKNSECLYKISKFLQIL